MNQLTEVLRKNPTLHEELCKDIVEFLRHRHQVKEMSEPYHVTRANLIVSLLMSTCGIAFSTIRGLDNLKEQVATLDAMKGFLDEIGFAQFITDLAEGNEDGSTA